MKLLAALTALPLLALACSDNLPPPSSSPQGLLGSAESSSPGAPAPAPAASLPPCDWAQVTRVVDGDTIHVLIDDQEDTVRYIGVDSPETVDPRRGTQPFGHEAAQLNTELVGGKRVCLERDVTDRDRFSRLLRYVWLEDGTFVNEEMLLAGLAMVSTYPPDVKYVDDRYIPAQVAARDAGRGMWAVLPTP